MATSEEKSTHNTWLLPVVVAVLVILLALSMRLGRISDESVDGDEMFSRRVVVDKTTSQTLSLVRQDLVHPPLYYLALKTTLPNDHAPTVLAIRLLSLVAGVASMMLVILIGYLVPALRGPSYLAAVLLALNKTDIFYSQEARSYSLFCFVVGLLLLWSVLMNRYGHLWKYWLAGTILMTVLVYIHYFGVFYCTATVLPVLLTKSPRRLRFQALGSLGIAGAAFIPWVAQMIPVYRQKAGLGSNLGWEGTPTFYDLKMTFADYLGVPSFPGATSLVFIIGAVLVTVALLPAFPKEDGVLDSRSKITLAIMAIAPPPLAFILSGWPLHLPIFGARHVFPSILAVLILICYGLWRLVSRTARPIKVATLVIGATTLIFFQIHPVVRDWSKPIRPPYEKMANWLRQTEPNLPIYTTWTYGIGAPMEFYMGQNCHISEVPSNPATLPAKFVMIYRPAVSPEEASMKAVQGQFDVVEQRAYANSFSGSETRVVVLQRRKETATRSVSEIIFASATFTR